MPHVELLHFSSPTALAEAAAQAWIQHWKEGSQFSPSQTVALSGGRIALGFFQAAVAAASQHPQVFQQLHFFWADERCVPPDHPESNFASAKKLLLDPLQIPLAQIHRIRGELPPPKASSDAEQELTNHCRPAGGKLPALDLIILGMGEDGHVASLFPGDTRDDSGPARIYRSVTAVKPPPERVTLTYPMLQAAREVWVLASGTGKETALRQSLESGETPLGRVRACRTSIRIYTELQF